MAIIFLLSWLFGFGSSNVLDTYLSQEHYSGYELDVLCVAENSSLLVTFGNTTPRSDRAHNLMIELDYAYAYTCARYSINNVRARATLQGDLFLGGIYNTANGNNPAQLRAGLDLAPGVNISYPFTIGNSKLRLNYDASLPLIGAAFSPQYGQSYYELFSTGGYDHNICLTHIGQAVNFRQRLTVDFLIGPRALTLGYLNNIRQSNLNNLKYHDYSHAFLIGYTL